MSDGEGLREREPISWDSDGDEILGDGEYRCLECGEVFDEDEGLIDPDDHDFYCDACIDLVYPEARKLWAVEGEE
jgi:hypothetical protein